MNLAIGSDHRGFAAKQRLIGLLTGLGHTVRDFGVNTPSSVDYPDIAWPVAQAVARGEFDRGILFCGTGIGMSIAANKVAGVRAAACGDLITAELSRRHNDANILCLSADLLGEDAIEKMVRAFLSTDFEGGRHARRIEKITRIEAD